MSSKWWSAILENLQIDILVNNAGITRDKLIILRMTEEIGMQSSMSI